ncbi:MAG: hypothetical protein ACRD36_11285, partial [Candidatus Acidiferrum sp.]
MNIAVLPALLALLVPAAFAQTPQPIPSDVKRDIQMDIQNPIKTEGAVPVADEPHYAHTFQNDYVHVYSVTIPPLDSTLLYRDDLPYISMTLGSANIVDTVAGKPPAQITLEDRATRYSSGGLAHTLRTDAGIPFHGVTVELVHPQDSPRNLGNNANDRPLGSCPLGAAAPTQDNQLPFEQVLPCFETSEVHMDQIQVEGGKDFVQSSPETAALLIATSDASLDVSLGNGHAAFL